MSDKVLLSAGLNNAEDVIRLAKDNGLGVELMAFAMPAVLDGDWRSEITRYRDLIKGVAGNVTIHGPFMDMVSGSPDPRINAVCITRYSHAIRAAAELNIYRVVLHANFIGSLHNTFYREGWHQRNVEFWWPLAQYAKEHGVTIALENMWEFDPTIIADLLTEVNHPYLRACLDVGHAHLFSDSQFTFDYWLRVMEPWLVEIHSNNNNGILDEHHGYSWENGVLDYHKLVPKLRALSTKPEICLEMDRVEDMAESLGYFDFSDDSESVRQAASDIDDTHS